MGFVYELLVQLRFLIDLVQDFFFGLYFKSQRNRLPPIENDIVLESACSLADKIKNRTLKAEDVVAAFIERTKAVNPLINAMVDERFLDALKEARKIDEDLRLGRLTEEDLKKKPFLGVPFTAKESTACKGLKWTLGLLVRKNFLAEEDAAVTELMKQAGAINIGVTNVPQVNFWGESYNPIHGTCKNPYDLSRNPGGSSGGEGSLIAACGSPIGIGTDVGGSIRIPSHRCGIFGHKPSPDVVPTKGLAFSKGDVPILTVAGPMAKRAEDLLPMLKVLAGENINKLKLDEKVDVKNLNIYYMTSIKSARCGPIQKDIRSKLMKVIDYFEEISGERPEEVDFEDTRHAMLLWSYMIRTQSGMDFNFCITNKRGRVNVPLEYLKYIFGMSEYNLYSLCNMINYLLPHVDFEWAKETLKKLKETILAKLGDNGVLILPSESRAADYHYMMLLRPHLTYFALWNALEMPVTQVPLGLNSEGLPIGIQIVTAPYQDHLSIAVARELENAFKGYVPP